MNKAELWGLWCDGTCADGASKISGNLKCKWCTVGLSTHWKSNPQILYMPISQITYPAVITLLHKSLHCFHIKSCQSKVWLSSTKSILSPSIMAALSVLTPENCLVSSFHHASADPCLLSIGNSHHLVKHFLAPPWHISTCLAMLGIWLTFINKLTYLIFSVIQCISQAKNSAYVLTSAVPLSSFQLRLQGHYHSNEPSCILLSCVISVPDCVLLLIHFTLKKRTKCKDLFLKILSQSCHWPDIFILYHGLTYWPF